MSLQFHGRSGYFSALARGGLACAVTAVLAGCGERDRLTFPVEDPGDGVGPFTTITRPDAGDTLVDAGEPFVLEGYTTDHDGVDSVFFAVAGAGVVYPPLAGASADSVRFAIQLPTADLRGDTIFVRVFAVDQLGDPGRAALRQIRIR